MYCININHPEYKTLKAESGLHSGILQYKISAWFTQNGDSRFPSLKEINNIPTEIKQVKPKVNPIKELGLKYNADFAGFMPFNINLADLQRDARKLDLKVLKAANGAWYLKNSRNQFVNPRKFLQINSQSSILPYKDLKDKLFSWAETHGISVITMEEMMNTVANTDSLEGSVAVADLFNRIIALDPEKEMNDTLAEEVSHFATAILKEDASVKKAMENISKTEIYKEVKEVYADTYETEEEFKKEAVDKLLAQSILDNFQETTDNKGVLPYIKGIFSKFKKWLNSFKKSSAAEQIKNDLAPLAKSILRNEYLGTLDKNISNTVYLQREQLSFSEEEKQTVLEKQDNANLKTKAAFAIKTVNLLSSRLGKLQQAEALGKTAKKGSVTDTVREEIKKLRLAIKEAEFTGTITKIIEFANTELEFAKNQVEKMDTDGVVGHQLQNLKDFVESYADLFQSLRKETRRMGLSKAEKDQIHDSIKGIQLEINSLETDVDYLEEEFSPEVLDEGNTDSSGKKIDPNFDGKEINQFAKKDASVWRLNAGNYKFANSGILRSAHKIIFDAAQIVKRFAIGKGNILLRARMLAAKEGTVENDLIDTDSDGKFTQYLIRREDWADYYKKMGLVKQELADYFGFETFEEINLNEESKEKQKYYKETFKNFHKENSVTISDAYGRFAGRKPKKLNPKFAELMKRPNTKKFYDLLVETKTESLAKLPLSYRTPSAPYLLPGVRSSLLEKFTDKNQSFLTNLQEAIGEGVLIDEDDTEFGEIDSLGNKMIPIYFTHRFEKPGNVSRNIVESFTTFSEMAENFVQMGNIAGDLSIVQNQLAKREYQIGRDKKTGKETRDYQILKTMIDNKVYGIQSKDVSVSLGDNPLTRTLSKVPFLPNLVDKKFSFTKLAKKISSFISTNNLALNPFTSTAGWMKGSLDSILEAQVGLYSTIESNNWAIGEYSRNIVDVLTQVGNKKQTNKMHLLLQRYNVVELSKMLKNVNKNKLLSDVTSRDLLFLNYRTADYAVKGRVALNILDSTRLVDGEFINRKNFLEKRKEEGVEEKTAKEEWKTYREKSLYNAYEVVDGNLEIKSDLKQYVNDGLENSIVGKVGHVTSIVDGTLTDSDKGAIAREVYGSFVLMHRGWFINMIDTRFFNSKGGVNFITGEAELGLYPGMWKFIRHDLVDSIRAKQYNVMNTYKKADPVVQRAVKKTILDLVYLNVIGLIAAIANVAAEGDEEENPLLQIAAYQLNRVLLEQSAGQPIFNQQELLQIIDEPVVGVKVIKDLLDISEIFNSDVYESGMYKGKTHSAKWILKKMPGVKNIYESRFAEQKNKFLKNKIIKSRIYDIMSSNTEREEFGIMQRLGLFFKNQDEETNSITTEDLVETIDALENMD